MSRGRKPGAIQEGSLVAKLLNIRLGEAIHLDDRQERGRSTLMERQITNVIAKSPALAGRTFSTERWVAIQSNPIAAKAIIAVRRTN